MIMFDHLTGDFEVKGESLVISDPCYVTKDLQIIVEAVNGNWASGVLMDLNGRVEALLAWSTESKDDLWADEAIGKIGVDSGQAGIFDASVYSYTKGRYGDSDTFYDQCCAKTQSKQRAGTVPGGVASVSGWGDGEYDVYVARNSDGKVVSVMISFLDDVDEEEDEEDLLAGDPGTLLN